MRDKDYDRLFTRLDRIVRRLPRPFNVWLAWVLRPSSRFVRIPLGALLVIGGIVSILPLLGVWMLPLGLMLLALDMPLLRRPVNRALMWLERRLLRQRRRRRLNAAAGRPGVPGS